MKLVISHYKIKHANWLIIPDKHATWIFDYKRLANDLKGVIGSKLDLKQEIHRIHLFILAQKRVSEQNPRTPKIKKQYRELSKSLHMLLTIITEENPVKIGEMFETYRKIYPRVKFNDITLFSTMLAFVINNFNAICYHFKKRKISVDLANECIEVNEKILQWFKRNPVSVKIRLDLAIELNIATNVEDFRLFFIENISNSIHACETIIKSLKDDKGGRPPNIIARNILIELASLYYRAKNKMPTAYASDHSKGLWNGTLYKMIMVLSPFFDFHGLEFHHNLTSLGGIAMEDVLDNLMDNKGNLKTFPAKLD